MAEEKVKAEKEAEVNVIKGNLVDIKLIYRMLAQIIRMSMRSYSIVHEEPEALWTGERAKRAPRSL